MRIFWRILSAIIALLYLLAIWRLGSLERSGPPHFDTTLDGGIPATVYIPGKPGSLGFTPLPPPVEERPPVVVLLHGYSADRASMSTLARRFAQNGIAVVSIEFAGHGINRNAFSHGITDEMLVQETKAAVEYARSLPLIDGSRIIVVGHSMGAGTALDYSQRDSTIAGAVMISGGFDLYGPQRPRNALFIYAQHDPVLIRTLARQIAAKLAGTDQLQLNKIYGDVSAGTAVEAIEVAGVDHIRILFSVDAANEILDWCDRLFDFKPPAERNLSDPRISTQFAAFILFLVLLVPLGFGLGAMAPVNEQRLRLGTSTAVALTGLAVALLVALPLVSTYVPAQFLALDTGDILISWLSIAGIGIIGMLALTDKLHWLTRQDGLIATVFTAVLGVALIYVLQVPRDVTLHNLSFTPERLVAFIFSSILLLPFWLGFEQLVRRGRSWISPIFGITGRAIIILVLILGLSARIIPSVVGLLLPAFVIYMIEAEIVSASIYASSGNIILAGLIEAAWLAWLVAAIMPITMML